MSESSPVCRVLDQQYLDYEEMLELGRGQRVSLEQEDLPAVERSFSRLHRLMDQIRLRQASLPELDRSVPEVEARCRRLERIIGDLQDLRRCNQELARRLMERTAAEIRQLGQSRRAFGHHRPSGMTAPRLFDGTR